MKRAFSFLNRKTTILFSLLLTTVFILSCDKEEISNCEAKPCDDAIITLYDPVCGCNKVTYSNSSEAECNGITDYTQGECQKEAEDEVEGSNCEETKCDGGWTKIYDPVCGCNDVTYSNASEAECKGITSYTQGKCQKEESDCEEKICDGVYIEIYDPVCGCNGKTYSNSGVAECKGITSYTQGKCKKEEEETKFKETKCESGWTKIDAPVCGCNNVTYSNASEAECKGITSYTNGECGKKSGL